MLLYAAQWNVDLSFSTILLIGVALIGVFLGEVAGTKIRLFSINTVPREEVNYIYLSKKASAICAIFVMITAILYYREIVKIAANSAYANSVYGQAYSFLMQVRWAKILEGANVAYYVQQMFTCAEAIACILLYILIHNKVQYKKMGGNIFAYGAIAGYIITSFMTTGRAKMLSFFIYAICVWLILNAKKKNWVFKNNIKLFARAVMVVGVAILLFYLAGLLTEKSLHYDNFFDNFANYFSSSLYALDQYMKKPQEFGTTTDFFGIHTLSGIYSFLRKLFPSIPKSVVVLEYIKCGKYLTNIYTPLRRYLQDFSWTGVFIIMFVTGYVYKRLVWLNKNKASSPLYCVFAAYFLFPLFFISIEERIFMDVVMIRSVYNVFYLVLVYQWLVNKRFFKYRLLKVR